MNVTFQTPTMLTADTATTQSMLSKSGPSSLLNIRSTLSKQRAAADDERFRGQSETIQHLDETLLPDKLNCPRSAGSVSHSSGHTYIHTWRTKLDALFLDALAATAAAASAAFSLRPCPHAPHKTAIGAFKNQFAPANYRNTRTAVRCPWFSRGVL